MKNIFAILLFFILPLHTFCQVKTNMNHEIREELDHYLKLLFVKEADTVLNIDSTMIYKIKFTTFGYRSPYDHTYYLDDKSLICTQHIFKGDTNMKLNDRWINKSTVYYTELKDSSGLKLPYFYYENVGKLYKSQTLSYFQGKYNIVNHLISFEKGKYIVLSEIFSEPDIRGSAPDSNTNVFFLERIE